MLVTRAREQAGGTADLLREMGAEPVVVPTIEIVPPADPAPMARAIEGLRRGAYDWVAFTSVNGVEAALRAAGGDAGAFAAVRTAAIGPATARVLEALGVRVDVTAREYRGEGLAEEMLAAITASGGSRRVLLACAAKARDVLPEKLRAAGCAVDVVTAYETRPASAEVRDRLLTELQAGRIDAVLFTSSSTVDNLCDLLGDRAAALLAGVRVASIGPITTDTARARGLRIDVSAQQYTIPGLVAALAESYG